MIKWISKIFSSDPTYYWGDFKEWDRCKACSHVAEFYQFDTTSSDARSICPKCGNVDHVKLTVGRWRSHNVGSGIAGVAIIRDEFEEVDND